MQIEKSAGAIIFIKDKNVEYLLLYRKAKPPYKESWDFPRGNIEDKDDEIQTVAREIKEETGISYLRFIKGFREEIGFFYRKEGILVRKSIVYYLAETNYWDVKISSEHNNFAWLTIDDAMARLKHKDVRGILKKAHKIIDT